MCYKNKMAKTYIVDIASVYGVDEKDADNLQVRPDSLNQEWLSYKNWTKLLVTYSMIQKLLIKNK